MTTKSTAQPDVSVPEHGRRKKDGSAAGSARVCAISSVMPTSTCAPAQFPASRARSSRDRRRCSAARCRARGSASSCRALPRGAGDGSRARRRRRGSGLFAHTAGIRKRGARAEFRRLSRTAPALTCAETSAPRSRKAAGRQGPAIDARRVSYSQPLDRDAARPEGAALRSCISATIGRMAEREATLRAAPGGRKRDQPQRLGPVTV